MLKPASDAAECFLADAEIRSDEAEWNPFNDMWCLLYQLFVSFFGRFELCIHISFFQPDVIFFISNSYQSFNIMMLIEQICQLFFAD